MFPEGSKKPYPQTQELIQKLAAPLKATPYRVSITGHTSAPRTPPPVTGRGIVGRPRQCRAPDPRRTGLASGSIYQVAGKADTDPLFPDDPYIAANRRVTITLMREARRCRPIWRLRVSRRLRRCGTRQDPDSHALWRNLRASITCHDQEMIDG